MKIKGLLLGMFACAALASCTNNDLVEENGTTPELKGDAYMAVKLVTSGTASRAASDGGFVDGSETESVVNNARFYFFDANGNAYAVDGNGKNYVDIAKSALVPETDNNNANSIESTIPVSLKAQATVPSSVIVVLNYDQALGLDSKNASLTTLQNALLKTYNTTAAGFVMSNSVYAYGGNEVNATSLTADNFYTSPATAAENPVNVYVERIAARVDVKTTDNNKYDTEKKVGDTKIYAHVDGFAIFDNANESYAVKKIDKTWTNEDLGFTWNDASNYRSYWAENPTEGFVLDGSLSYSEAANLNSKYCFENAASSKENATQVFIAATLQDEKGQPVAIVKWMNDQFVGGEEALKNKVAMALQDFWIYTGSKEIPDGTETEYQQIPVKDIAIVPGSKSYQVKPVLADPNKTYYKKDASGRFITNEEIAANIKNQVDNFPAAEIYTDGKTYYFTPIEHLAQDVYGVIRNHVYQINIDAIKGLGTPVYNPDSETEFDPTTPDEDPETFISARINVLSWKVSTQHVTLGK